MIRLITLNLWQEQGPWERRLEMIRQRLAELRPDVVCLQEVRQKAGVIPNQAETLASGLGLTNVHYCTAQPWGGGDEGVAIISRFPLQEKDSRPLPHTEGRSGRVCVGACLEAPEGAFWAFTTHLAYRLTDGALREAQVSEVDRFVSSKASSTASILAGDFNARPESDEIRFLKGLTSIGGQRTFYQDAFALRNPGAAGHTWCSENPYTAALSWLEPDRRLDYIFVTPQTSKGAGVVHRCRIVCNEPDASGLWCSDHYALLAEISVAGASIQGTIPG